MSGLNPKSGAQKRKERAAQAQKDDEFVQKVPKIHTFFSPISPASGSSSSAIPAQPLVEAEACEVQNLLTESDVIAVPQLLIHEDKDNPDIDIGDLCCASDNSVQGISEAQQVTDAELPQSVDWIETDPAKWDPKDERLKENLAATAFPSRNIQESFPETRREYPFKTKSKFRQLQKELFSFRMPNGELVQRDWLVYSASTKTVFCFVCKLFSTNENAFCTFGFNDWNNDRKRVNEHAHSHDHFNAEGIWVARRNQKARIDNELQSQYEKERCYWRSVLKRVVAVVRFLSERGLAFRGGNSTFGSAHNGNFLGILELIGEFDPFLAEHIKRYGNKGKGTPSYLSQDICNEFIQCMSAKVEAEIIRQLKESKYYSISVDSTPDVSHVDQLTFIVRYITDKGEPVERFIKFIKIFGHGAEYLSTIVVETLQELDLDIADCRGQTYDNASNMSGKYTGLQQRIRDINPLAEFVPCAAHSLNLVGACAAECCVWAVTFFGFVQELYNFFSASTHRWDILVNALPAGAPVPKSLSATRWSARADASHALRKGFVHIRNALRSIESEHQQPLATRSEARRLASQMDKLEIALMAVIWDNILERFNKTNKSLQSSTIDLGTALALYDSLMGFLQKIRCSEIFAEFEFSAKELSNNQNYKEKRQRKHPQFFDELPGSAELQQLPQQEFRTMVFYTIIDAMTTALQKRRDAYLSLSDKFGFLHNITKISTAELKESANHLIECYPKDLNENFSIEIVHFASFAENLDDQHPVSMLTVIRESHLRSTFPNVDIALRMYLCNFATNCTGERSFSVLPRVKGKLRANIAQLRMSALSLLCIESDLLNSLSFNDVIDDFASLKSRKKPL